jgi:hypothetical protein
VKRRLLNLLVALSLTVCVAAIALWVRSYTRSDTVWHSRVTEGEAYVDARGWQLDTARGDVAVRRQFSRVCHGGVRLGNRPDGWYLQSNAPTDRVFFASGALTRFETGARAAGFEYYSAQYDGADGSRSGQRRIVVPFWAVVLLTAPLPAVRLWRRVSRGGFGPGHCRGCGYDLRGNESGVCPECGRAVPPA